MLYLIFKDNSVIFSNQNNKINILKTLSEQSLFFDINFLDYKNLIGHIDNRYYFYLKDKFNISYDLSKEIRNYLPFILNDKTYKSSRLNELRKIKTYLLEKKIYSDLNIKKNKTIYRVNHMPIPNFIKKEIHDLSLDFNTNTPITLSICKTQKEQSYSVYETVIELLEKKVNIEDIIILNASLEDEFNIQKLFRDSKIPYISSQKKSLTKYSKISNLIDILTKEGLKEGLDYVNNELSPLLRDKLISIYNRCLDKDILNNMDVFISLIKDSYIDKLEFTKSIKFNTMNDYIYDKNKYYLLMNYNDSDLVIYKSSFSYLTKKELQEICYYSIDELNNYLEEDMISQLETIENLYLFFSEISESENLLPVFAINREIRKEIYNYQVKETSYLKTLNALEYAKALYDLNTFYLKRNDFFLLYNTYNDTQMHYLHEFTGINEEDLKFLLIQNNTLTASKIESYNLCQFQYLLRYLLKLDNYESSTYQFLGKLSHKVFEKVTKDEFIDINNIVLNYLDFPKEEFYKEKIYREALLKELKKIVPILIDFHRETEFKIIETELEFKVPYKEFFITGIIDKAMVYRKIDNFFILVDYKLNDKDFDVTEVERGRLLQLPLYLFAYTSINKGYKPVGLYYQKTSIGRYKSNENGISDAFKLRGVSLKNKGIIQALDLDLKHIKSLSYKKDGDFRKDKHLISENEFIKIKEAVINHIEKMISNIKRGQFKINPLPEYSKKTGSISCEYCKFESICYNKNKGLGGESL